MLVNDLRGEAATSLLEAAAAARDTDFLITCLPAPAVVSQVMEGSNGVLGQLAAGATWIKMTTTDGDEVKRLAALEVERGVNTVESPVTCGVERAISGDLTLLVGGEAAHIEACREVFDAVASKVVHTGPLGSSSVIKLITNLFAYVHLWAMGDGLMLGKKAGIDVATTLDAIKAS